MSTFSWARDSKNIMWMDTGLLMLVRGVCSGLVWTIIVAFTGQLSLMELLIAFPTYAVFFTVLPLLAIVISMLCELIPFIGIFNLVFLLMLLPGDILVFILHKLVPGLVPVESYPILNFRAITYVLRDISTEPIYEPERTRYDDASDNDRHGPQTCPDCDGPVLFGNEGNGKCSACHGTGNSNIPAFIPGQNEGNCHNCKGTGICPTCNGKGVVS